MWRITILLIAFFNGLHGYILHDTNRPEFISNEKMGYYTTSEVKITPKSLPANHFVNYFSDETEGKAIEEDATPLDKWSVVWYVASFGGLIAFFLIVSCSEWCCRRSVRNNYINNNPQTAIANAPETPPPSYDHFAPPAYDSLSCDVNMEKSEFDVYVVPVHALGSKINSSTRVAN